MTTPDTESLSRVQTSSSVAKFLIGFIAGCAVIIIPRLSSFLMAKGTLADVDFFPSSYLIAIVIFALFLGAIIVIMEFRLARPPKETFFAALAIPGLIAGSLNTALESDAANDSYRAAQQLSQSARQENNIPVQKIKASASIAIPLAHHAPIEGDGVDGWRFNLDIVPAAHAQEGPQLTMEEAGLGVTIQRGASKFAVSLGTFDDKQVAITEAKKLKELEAGVTLIEAQGRFEVLASDQWLTEVTATVEALRLKKKLDIAPKILELE